MDGSGVVTAQLQLGRAGLQGFHQVYKISEEERKEGGDELTGVNWVPVDPATHQATKIACGVRTWIKDVQFFQN